VIVENPEVTLDEEGHGFPEEARDTAQLDWVLVVPSRQLPSLRVL
jgi:hypothetical protein